MARPRLVGQILQERSTSLPRGKPRGAAVHPSPELGRPIRATHSDTALRTMLSKFAASSTPFLARGFRASPVARDKIVAVLYPVRAPFALPFPVPHSLLPDM